MRLVFFSHPSFIGSQSMPRFTKMLVDGMRMRGHEVEILQPNQNFFQLPAPRAMKKWLGYIDRFIVFPRLIIKKLENYPSDTLFIITDNAQGPWVPLIAHRHHVIHCHDFLAQRSAIGTIPQNPTSWSGRQYQNFIRWGYNKGKNFISVSNRTKADLHAFLSSPPLHSEVLYNSLNQSILPIDSSTANKRLEQIIGINLTSGYFLHVGSNQWYKNRIGVVDIYDAWRTLNNKAVPLLMIGVKPNIKLLERHSKSPYKADIHFLSDLNNETVQLGYSGAHMLLFPSLAEGFGWPIAEAMAAGCLVITTDEDPMKEVAGEAGFFIPSYPLNKEEVRNWALKAAHLVNHIMSFDQQERHNIIKAGLKNIQRFDPNLYMDRLESIYSKIVNYRA